MKVKERQIGGQPLDYLINLIMTSQEFLKTKIKEFGTKFDYYSK